MLDVRDLPGNLLANCFLSGDTKPTLKILTAPRGAGKTKLCLRLHAMAELKGLQPRGLISVPVFDGENKVAIDLLDLSTGDHCRLAKLRRKSNRDSLTLDWQFSSLALLWGNSILERTEHSQLLIIDEIGPMEFLGQEGLQAAFPLISKRAYQIAVVVIRPSLLSIAIERWPWAEIIDIGGEKND